MENGGGQISEPWSMDNLDGPTVRTNSGIFLLVSYFMYLALKSIQYIVEQAGVFCRTQTAEWH